MKNEKAFNHIKKINVVIVLVTITIFSMLFSSSSKFIKEVIGAKNIPAKSGIVTSADVIVRDGAAPFDSNDNAGNDSNDHNNIVRSNDKLVYEIKPYVNLTSSSPTNIIIKGTLPKKNLIYWHKEEIDKFAKGYIKYSQDSNNYYFTYERNYNELTAEKGSSTISLYFDVLVSGAKNNEIIEPTFEIYMSGNNEGQKKKIKPNAVKVSSVNRTKIELGQGGRKQEKVTYNGKVGRMNAISVYVKMENDKNKKGLIGLEYPQEDILSDIEFKTFLNPKNGWIKGQKKEFVGDLRPEVMQYGLNTLGEYEFKMKGNENYPYYYIIDTGLPDNRRLYRTYDGVLTFVNKDNYITGGNIEINNIIKGSATVRFFNYLLNEKNIFPVGGIWASKRDYPETDGYITAANIVVFCPFPDEEYIQGFLREKGSSILPGDFDYTVDLEVKLKNKRVKENNQDVSIDRESSRTYICNKKEKPKDEAVLEIEKNGNDSALPKSVAGDRSSGLSRVTDTFEVSNGNVKFFTQDEEYKTYGTAIFLKFDGDLIEPTGNITRKFHINKIYYLTKKDGKNWTSENEMKNARYDAFNYYGTVEEAKKHGIIVGIAGQGVKPEGTGNLKGNMINYYYAEFKIKENVKSGTVGLFSNMVYNYFKRDENQDGGNFLDGTFRPPSDKEGYFVADEFPNTAKTKYDSEGKNTNEGNPYSYLILNAMPEIKIETNRNIYNLINKESVVNISIVPSIKTSVRASKTEKKKVRTEITIPKGLEFDKETVKISGESAKPSSVTKVGDNTKVVFEYETTYDEKDYTSKVITFNAKIDRALRNNTYLKMDALTKIIGEAPSYITERQASKSINVQNSLAEVAYQNIKRRVIEYGENFNFEIAMLNNSRNSHQEVTLFNILPYNTGDATNSESYFDGTYKISNLKSSLNADIYYTTDEKIRNYNAKNYNEAGVTWHRYTGGSIENVKAIYSKSSINAYSDHKITFDILPVGQKVTNTYINDFSTHIKGQGGILQVKEKVAIAKRNIQGKVWEDKNIDGKITEGEKNLKDIILSLRQENGQKVTRLDGTVVEDVVTNEKGEYVFEDVSPIKNLKVVMHKNDNMQVTKKGLDNVANNEFEMTNISPMPAIDMNKDDTTLNYIQNLTKYNIGIIYKKDVQVKKIWKNGNNRPEIEVVLYRNIEDGKKEEVKKKKITTEANSNKSTYTFSNLEVIDENDNIYTYSADEINVPKNYIKEISQDGLTITNIYSIPKKDITIKKIWKNGNNRPDVEVVLYRNIEGGKKEEVKKVTLKTPEGSNEVTHTFNSLDKTDISGNEYTYTIDELTNVENYTKEIDNEKMQITNTYNVPKKEVTGKVVWVNGKKREDVTLILYRKDNNGKEEEVDRKVVSTEKGKNETTYTWNNIDKTNIAGNEYTYRVDEEKVPENYSKKISQDGLTITNSYVIPKENKEIKKLWKNGNNRPDIEAVLYRSIEGGNKEQVQKITVKTPEGSNEVTHTFNSLDKTDIAGNEYTYTIDEITSVENYTKEIDNEKMQITNTYNIPKKDITIKKVWKNGKTRPDVEVVLYRNIEGGNKEEVTRTTLKTQEGANEATHNFNSLDKTDIFGNEYTYTIDEITNVENYTKEIDNEKFQITNTYNVPKKDIHIKKFWKNGKARPDVELVLYRNIEGGKKEQVEKATVKTDAGSDEAKHIFSNMDKTDIAGNEYIYTIDEVNVPTNYTKKIVDNNTILNEYVSPKKDLKITKKWIGGSSRPDINVILYRHIKGEEKHKEKVQEQIVKTKEGKNESTYTFTNLDKTDKNANEYIYTIDEAKVPVNYVKEIDDEHYIIKNTYISPKREFDVTKKWVGGNKRDDIQIQLYRNGEKYLEPVTLKTDEGKNETKYTFRNLEKTDENANDYIYTADEVTTPTNFVKSLDTYGNSSNTITNTYISPKVDVATTKKWVDGENARPDTITFALYRNIEGGKKEKVTEEKIKVTKDNELTHIFTKQDKTDKNGNIYTYSVEEINVPANYSKEETGLVVVNTYNSPKIDVPVSMIYINGKLKRKDVKIELLRNGKKIDEIEFKVEKENNEENKQEGKEQKDETKNTNNTKDKYEHVFKDLDKTDKSGKDYNYQIRQVTEVKDFAKKEQGLSVVNEYVIPKIDISITKKWIDSFGDKEKPEIEVGLYKDGKKYLDVARLKDGNTSYTWEKQDRTDKDGKEHSYNVKEELVPKYYNEKVVLKNDGEGKKEFEITNTFDMPKVNAKGNIIWKDGPDSKPEVEIELLANDKKVDKIALEDGKTDFEFKNLDIFDKYGKEIKYSVKQNILTKKYVKENNIKYDLKYDSNIESKEVLDIEKDREFEITNTYIIPKTEMKAKKTWINAEGNKPNISLTLYKDGKRVKEQVLQSGKSECVFENLDMTDEKGNEYKYSIDEEKVPEGYIKKKSKEGNTIVNIRDKKDEELPYAGTKGNNPLKLSLIILAILLIKIRRDKKRMYNIGI